MSVSLIGTTMNDWYAAAFVMAALWLVVRGGEGAPSTRTLLAAGALVGAGAGLKLTGTIYCVGLSGVFAGRLARRCARGAARGRRRDGVRVDRGAVDGAHVRALRQSAVSLLQRCLPFAVGRSCPFSAMRFGPTSPAEWLVFPFVLLWKLEDYVSEPEFRDARPALLYVLALISFVFALSRSATRAVREARTLPPGDSSARSSRIVRRMGVLYRIFRYLVPLELLAGAFIVFLLMLAPRKRAPGRWRRRSAVVVTAKFPRGGGRNSTTTSSPSSCRREAGCTRAAGRARAHVVRAAVVSRRRALRRPGHQLQRSRPPQPAAADDRRPMRGHRGPLYALAVPPGRDVGGAALAKMGLARGSCSRSGRTSASARSSCANCAD